MPHEHEHDHDDDRGDDRGEHVHADVPAPIALRVKALQSLLIEKGLIDEATIDRLIDTYEHRIGPHRGAAIVARAWTDAAFKQRLLTDGTGAVFELGLTGFRKGSRLVAIENTPSVHNVVVCTLCSCYPNWLLGLPPVWYKSAPYRSRTVLEPRVVLAEFGVSIADDVEVRVWDSNSEVRYIVVPQRPAGTEGWTEQQLAALVDRDAMIGVGLARDPSSGAETSGSTTA